MRQAGLPVRARLDALLSRTDVVVDCTPKKVAAKNWDLYGGMVGVGLVLCQVEIDSPDEVPDGVLGLQV